MIGPLIAIYLMTGVVWALCREIWTDALLGVREAVPVTRRRNGRYFLACALAITIGCSIDVLLWPYIEWKIRRWER